MKIDFSTTLTDLSGEPIRQPSADGDEVMTVGMVSITALLTTMSEPHTGRPEVIAATEKVRYAKLAQDIFSAKAPLDVSVEDVALLKERIGRFCTPLAVARAWAILDPAAPAQ